MGAVAGRTDELYAELLAARARAGSRRATRALQGAGGATTRIPSPTPLSPTPTPRAEAS